MARKITVITRSTPTPEEDKAIKALAAALRKFPPHLSLFGWSGTLCVVRDRDSDCEDMRPLATIGGIDCDGGDPNDGGDPHED